MKRKRTIVNPNHNYEAAYKKSSGELLWISCTAGDSKEADNMMDAYVATKYANKGYNRYAGALMIKKHVDCKTVC